MTPLQTVAEGRAVKYRVVVPPPTYLRRLRRMTVDYLRWRDIEERRRLWNAVEPQLGRLERLRDTRRKHRGPWADYLSDALATLRQLDPALVFPQPPIPQATTDKAMRSALIREVHGRTDRRALDSAKSEMTAKLLRDICPELCADLTAEQVRKLVGYRRKK
jgi:hypothetical protein